MTEKKVKLTCEWELEPQTANTLIKAITNLNDSMNLTSVYNTFRIRTEEIG